MPATLNQTVLLKDGTVLQASDLKVNQIVSWSCDSPRCAARHGKTTEFTWDEGEATKDIKSLPDEFFRILKVHYNPLNNDQALAFCSVTCLKDWATYAYTPPKSGRQILAEKEAKDAAQMELPFDEPPINPISCAAPLQDTGDPWASSDLNSVAERLDNADKPISYPKSL